MKLEVGDRVRHRSPEISAPLTAARSLRGRVVSVFRDNGPSRIWMVRVKRDGRKTIDTWAMSTWERVE